MKSFIVETEESQVRVQDAEHLWELLQHGYFISCIEEFIDGVFAITYMSDLFNTVRNLREK